MPTPGSGEVPIEVLARYFRVPTGGLAVDYPGRDVFLTSTVTNISMSGVFIRTTHPLPVGATLRVEFSLPQTKTAISAEAVVRWSSEQRPAPGLRPESETPTQGMGLEFTKISRRQAKAVEMFVKRFLARMRG